MSSDKTPESYEVIVIGGGKGGKTLAVDLGNRGIKTALIERDSGMIGGSCINVACIPSKSFIASARVAHTARHVGDFGVQTGSVTVEWDTVKKRVEGIVSAMRAMNHKNITSAPSLDFILGTAHFVGPHVVEVREGNGTVRTLSAEKIFINTGSRPAQIDISGLAEVRALNSESIQHLDVLPRHLLIIGGSYVGLEFAQMFRFLGSEVTVLERGGQLLKHEDEDVAEALAEVLRNNGIDIRLNCAVERVENEEGNVAVILTENEETVRVSGSHLLIGAGRTPNTQELNLSAAGVETDALGYVRVNERLETSASGIWALGDVNGGPQFTHVSLDDYRLVKANVFDGGNRSTSDRLVPFTLFTEPELARVGLTEKQARQRGLEIRVAKFPGSAIPRAKTTSETQGLIKAVIDTKTDRILGCTIFTAGAGEVLGAVQMAMIAGLPFTALRDAVLSHPTMVEGFNYMFANF